MDRPHIGSNSLTRMEDLTAMFKEYDVAADGFVGFADLVAATADDGDDALTVEEAQALIYEFDFDEDGMLSFEEFEAYMEEEDDDEEAAADSGDEDEEGGEVAAKEWHEASTAYDAMSETDGESTDEGELEWRDSDDDEQFDDLDFDGDGPTTLSTTLSLTIPK